MKRFLPLLLCAHVAYAATIDPIAARDAALQQLRAFHPETIIPGFTRAPLEVKTNPNQTGSMNALQAEASSRVQQDKTARFTMQEGRKHEAEARPDISQETARGERWLDSDTDTPSSLPCVDGSCDKTVAEESNDVGEGLTSLGTLAGTAEDATANQIQSGQFGIFSGVHHQCKIYKVGGKIRDCCKDTGVKLVHCSYEAELLRQARQEGRAWPVGEYKNHSFSKHYMFCVFPSKLASIIQSEGRLRQLGINFGTARQPNCRGLTPEEMGRINFSALNLTSLTEGFTSRTKTPSDASLDAGNASHTSKLYDQGVAHD
jgi:hypothetical protein